MPEEEPLVVQSEAYKESDDFIPSPVDQYGTLDTSGTAGTAHSRLEEISPVFEVARKADLQIAARALDPEDTEVSESLVVLPEGVTQVVGDPEAAKKRVANKAAKEAKDPVVLGGPTLAQEEAAESGPDAALGAQVQQEGAGAGSGPTGDAEKRDEVTQTAGSTPTRGRPRRDSNS